MSSLGRRHPVSDFETFSQTFVSNNDLWEGFKVALWARTTTLHVALFSLAAIDVVIEVTPKPIKSKTM
jgi:hypothetical protein